MNSVTMSGFALEIQGLRGYYHVQQKGIQPDNNLRGIFHTDGEGRFHIRSAYPHHYPIPTAAPPARY